jgi:hypothetical protein
MHSIAVFNPTLYLSSQYILQEAQIWRDGPAVQLLDSVFWLLLIYSYKPLERIFRSAAAFNEWRRVKNGTKHMAYVST